MAVRHHLIKWLAWGLVAVWPAIAAAQGWTTGVWHQYTPASPLFDPSTGDRHGAAVLLESELAAMVLLYPDVDDGAQVIVEVQGGKPAAELTSRLYKANGSALALLLPQDRFVVSTSNKPDTQYYTFNVAFNDLENFMAASRWELETASGITKFPLTGTRDAISAAISDRADGVPQGPGDWIAECDRLAAHPWDPDFEGEDYGVAWQDMDGDAAVAACETALADTRAGVRILYQLGRAQDRTKDSKAVETLARAAESEGYAIALNHLGIIYRDGDYGETDMLRAYRLFEEASQKGSVLGSYNLARMLIEDRGGPAERARARPLMKEAAEAGYPRALVYHGRALIDGTYGAADVEDGIQYLQVAALQDDAAAAYALAEIYRDGTGVAPNPALYLEYLRAAADNGHAQARTELGLD